MSLLENFRYRDVKLTQSHWEYQRAELIETYLRIDNDDLLHYFRRLADIPDHADGLAGWYGDNASTFGQQLGAFARLYLETGDERLRKKAVLLADGWGECARKSVKVLDINSTYVYDKLMGGFLDLYEYLDYQPATDYIRMLTENGAKRFNKNVNRDGLQIMEPWMIEWYTLPEQLYRAYQLTGEALYLQEAKAWDYIYFWDKLIKHDFQIGPRHAYSHVNALSSAARAYIVTKNRKYLEAAENACEEILQHHTFATGGYGPAECLFADEDGYLGDSLKANWDGDKRHKTYKNFADGTVDRDDQWGSCEVSCCSWAVFKICNYLLTLTGDAKYGDWAERMLINGSGGQLPVRQDGQVMYYADYFINGGMKTTEDGRLHGNGASFEWQCCTGTFPQDVAEYSNMLYYRDGKDLYVSQYLPSSVTFAAGGCRWSLENSSFYPKEKEIRFVLHGKDAGSPEGTFALHFRVPSWAKGRNRVYVNGEEIYAAADPDTWMTLERTWNDGDTILITYEFELYFKAVDAAAPDVAALMYGPLTLVCDKMTLFDGDMEHPAAWIRPVQLDGYSFAFRTEPGHVKPFSHLCRNFYPYYEVPEKEWYYMYNRFVQE